MGRRIKLKDDTYLDDSSIHHNGIIQHQVIEEILADAAKHLQHKGSIGTDAELDALFDLGVHRYAGGSGGPFNIGYGIVLTIPYRKGTGNTKTDYTVQFFLPNGDDEKYRYTVFFRTSISSAWRKWIPLTNNYWEDTEICTNEMVDGYRVYAKRFVFTSTVNGEFTKAHGLTDLREFWIDTANSYMISNNTDHALRYPLPATEYYGNFSDRTGISIDKTNIKLFTDTGWGAGWTKVITVKYTKIND